MFECLFSFAKFIAFLIAIILLITSALFIYVDLTIERIFGPYDMPKFLIIFAISAFYINYYHKNICENKTN